MSDLDILLDSSLPMEERIKAAKSIAEKYDYGEATEREVRLFSEFMKMPIDELENIINKKAWVDDLEEAIIRGVYDYKLEKLKEKVRGWDIPEVARRYLETSSRVERRILGEILKERESEIDAMSLAAKALQADFLAKNIPMITSPKNYTYLSRGQIENIRSPTRFYAKNAFKNGLWNLEWGEPEEYGIDPVRWINYVSKPANRDFAVMMYRKGLWKDEWGSPQDYGIIA